MLTLSPERKKTSSSQTRHNPTTKGQESCSQAVLIATMALRGEERRQQLGQFSSLIDTQLWLEDPVAFQKYTRLTPQLFGEVSVKFQATPLTWTDWQ